MNEDHGGVSVKSLDAKQEAEALLAELQREEATIYRARKGGSNKQAPEPGRMWSCFGRCDVDFKSAGNHRVKWGLFLKRWHLRSRSELSEWLCSSSVMPILGTVRGGSWGSLKMLCDPVPLQGVYNGTCTSGRISDLEFWSQLYHK